MKTEGITLVVSSAVCRTVISSIMVCLLFDPASSWDT